MNKSEKFNEDILTRYINHEKIGKAPAGFTERVMNRIQMEKIPSAAGNSFLRNYKVLLISGAFTAALMISAILTSPTDKNFVMIPLLKPFRDLLAALQHINLEKFNGISFPGLVTNIALAIFILSLLDRALNVFFNRDRK
jgi:hypothetical protein